MAQTSRVLTLNVGSSSLKAALYAVGTAQDARLIYAAHAERLGAPHSHMSVEDGHGTTLFATDNALSDHHVALQVLLDWLHQQGDEGAFDVVGHRVVFG